MKFWFPSQRSSLSLWRGSAVHYTRLPENSWCQGVLISENSYEGLHLIRLGITQMREVRRAGCLMQTRKTKIQTQSSADRLPTKPPKHSPSHSLAHEREKKKKKHISAHQNAGTSPSQHKTYPNYWTNVTHWKQRPKRRRNMTLKFGKRRTQKKLEIKMKRQRKLKE